MLARRGRQHRRLAPGEHRRLVAVGADDQRNARHRPGARRVDRMVRQQVDAVGQAVRQRRVCRPRSRACSCPAARRSWRCGSALTSSTPTPSRSQEALRLPGPGLPVGDQRQRRALRDRAAEQAVGGRAGQQRQHRCRTRRFAEHRHPVGITAERGDVVAHPAQRRELVAQAQVVVEPVAEVAELESAEHAEPIGDVDDDDVAVGGQPGAVVELQLTRAVDERAAGNPHHHRQRAGRVGRPHRDASDTPRRGSSGRRVHRRRTTGPAAAAARARWRRARPSTAAAARAPGTVAPPRAARRRRRRARR